LYILSFFLAITTSSCCVCLHLFSVLIHHQFHFFFNNELATTGNLKRTAFRQHLFEKQHQTIYCTASITPLSDKTSHKLATQQLPPTVTTTLVRCSARRAPIDPKVASSTVNTATNVPLPPSHLPIPESPIPSLLPYEDSDDEEYISHYILDVVGDNIFHYDYLPMPDHNPTYALFSQDHHAPPFLMAGTLTLALLHTFQMGALQYFSQRNITADRHVPSIVWGLCDPRIQNWYINNTTRINMLAFNVFMDKVRVKWLMDGWEDIIEDSMLKS
jgi:hypothetical protein